ncbi:hypothetical protein BJ170DRAFT_204807 [Xylariales sp. AK1849]|nr:hypothetical protein BJ170DRAFT_204807 [Xylariales sp. AK1849]
MAVFVDLDEEEDPPVQQQLHHAVGPDWTGDWTTQKPVPSSTEKGTGEAEGNELSNNSGPPPAHYENPNRNAMTEALGCYPVAMAIASSLDLNALDNLSRTCRQLHEALLQYRSPLVTHTLHCVNEDVALDPEDTLRYRARAGNLYYMEELGRASGTNYNGKSGQCARDMVAECRRCNTVVCRNCAIKPPASIVLRDRHRRLCIPCSKAPLGTLAKPALLASTPVDADVMKRAICTCQSEGVWLCQPCGRSIRGADHDYQSIWRWRNQYGEVLGGLGTGIGDGDRGVICGRDSECCAAKEREHETDCDADDAREFGLELPSTSIPGIPWASTVNLDSLDPATPSPSISPTNSRRTPSPTQLGPGYARHEIEGIGGVVKTKRLSMVRVGNCVPEWEDEKNKGEILGREVSGRTRSWCGWCWRVIPGEKDLEKAAGMTKSVLPTVKA